MCVPFQLNKVIVLKRMICFCSSIFDNAGFRVVQLEMVSQI